MRKTPLSIAIAATFALASTVATAYPVLPQDSPILLKFGGFEQIDQSGTNNLLNYYNFSNFDANGDGVADVTTEGNWGVFDVSSVETAAVNGENVDIANAGTSFWSSVLGGVPEQGEITGMFYGVNILTGTTATSGFLDFYWSNTNQDPLINVSPTVRTGVNTATGFTDGTLLARIAFASGIIDGNSSTYISSTTSILGSTTFSGQAFSFGNVVDINNDGVINGLDGAWASALDSDWFYRDPDGDGSFGEAGETRDVKFQNNFNQVEAANPWNDYDDNIVGANLNDPMKAYVVPEPGTLALLGIAMAGLGAGATTRRRKSKV